MNYAMLAIVAALAACSNGGAADAGPGVVGTGTGAARSYAVADFTGVDLRGADDVDVRVGAGFSVRAEGPDKELAQLRIVRDGAALSIGRRGGMSWGSHDNVTVYVTLPRLKSASIAGSGNMTIDRVEGSAFDASVAGSGNMTVGTLAVDTASLAIPGSGDVKLAGTARSLAVDIAGSGDLDARGLTARDAQVSIVGSGSATALVDGTATVNLVGSGDVDLGPKANCTVTKVGSGSVRCR